MTLTVITATVILTLLLALLGLRCHQCLNHHRNMVLGTGFILHLKEIMAHLAQHRGMANTYLNGDETFLEKLKAQQSVIETDLTQVEEYLGRHKLPSGIVTAWQQIRDGWHQLGQDINTLSAGDSFERHSELIGQVLYLVSDCADETGITNHPDTTLKRLCCTTFNLLPPIIELVGQARGIGAGAAAKGTLLTAVRIKLEFLQQRLNASAGDAYAVIAAYLDSHTQLFHINADIIRNGESSTNHFLDTMTGRLLGNKITISTNDYFAEGSEAFNGNLILFEAVTKEIDQDIRTRLPRVKTALNSAIAVAIAAPLIILALWWQFGLT